MELKRNKVTSGKKTIKILKLSQTKYVSSLSLQSFPKIYVKIAYKQLDVFFETKIYLLLYQLNVWSPLKGHLL